MKIFKEYRQDQNFLLPPSLDEFVPEDHEARIINDVVDSIEVSLLLKKYEGGGAPAYHPRMMLKVLIYAYSNGIYSSRQMVKELKTDTAFMFLAGLQIPDFHTICLFRSQHADALPGIFVEVVRLCASLGMVSLGHIAFDGTKLKANASVRQSKNSLGLDREIERIKGEIERILEASAKIDALEDKLYPDGDGSEMPKELVKKGNRLKKLYEAKEQLESEKLKKINVTGHAAVLMKNGQGKIQPAYNGQVAVDAQEQIIVAAAITQHEADNFEFQPMMEQVDKNLGSLPEQGSADAGYFTYDNLEYAVLNGIDLYLPDPLLKALDSDEEGKFRYDKSRFLYNAAEDIYLCPERKLLRRYRELKRQDQPPLVVYRGESCGDCTVKGKCTRRSVREIFRDSREPLLEAMRAKLRTEEGKRTYNQRMYTVEPVFGNIKWNRAKLMLSLRGTLKVNGEFCLLCLVHNVKKIIKKVLEDGVDMLHNRRLIQIDIASVIDNSLAQATVAEYLISL